MKLIISMYDGSIYMLSANQITDIEFGASVINVHRISGDPEIFFYADIKSIVIS